jgi:hypothetical protein
MAFRATPLESGLTGGDDGLIELLVLPRVAAARRFVSLRLGFVWLRLVAGIVTRFWLILRRLGSLKLLGRRLFGQFVRPAVRADPGAQAEDQQYATRPWPLKAHDHLA